MTVLSKTQERKAELCCASRGSFQVTICNTYTDILLNMSRAVKCFFKYFIRTLSCFEKETSEKRNHFSEPFVNLRKKAFFRCFCRNLNALCERGEVSRFAAHINKLRIA